LPQCAQQAERTEQVDIQRLARIGEGIRDKAAGSEMDYPVRLHGCQRGEERLAVADVQTIRHRMQRAGTKAPSGDGLRNVLANEATGTGNVKRLHRVTLLGRERVRSVACAPRWRSPVRRSAGRRSC